MPISSNLCHPASCNIIRVVVNGGQTNMKFLLVILLVAWGGCANSAEPFMIFVSPVGNDSNDGLLDAYPVRTLRRAQDILEEHDPDRSIEIHINQGTYFNQSVIWTYSNNHSITFTPINFTKERPIFDGNGLKKTWFKLNISTHSFTQLKFRYIKVQNYNTAMSFEGNRNHESAWNAGNELYGMYFYRIGGRYSNSDYSTAAVRFVNSRNNSIINTHFVDILNIADQAAAIHAIYFAHYSSNNKVLRNTFLGINGDPIKVRDQSNYNYISNNRFESSGNSAFYQEWYCNKSIRNDCTKVIGECPSIGNEFRDNILNRGFSTDIKKYFISGDNDFCGVLKTSRLKVLGNTWGF